MNSVLREPLLHFFVLGGLLFLVQGGFRDEARVIHINQAIVDDLERRYEDTFGRKPTAAEQKAQLEKWKREEALFREAMRRGFAEDDANVRGALIENMRLRAELAVDPSQPSEEELRQWFEQHAERYFRPWRYDFDVVTFERSEKGRTTRADFLAHLDAGATPNELGREIIGGKLTSDELRSKLAPQLASAIPRSIPGAWKMIDGGPADPIWLIRLKQKVGGVPEFEQTRGEVLSDFLLEMKKKRVEDILDETVRLYDFEDER